jgi:hypothetical protein
VARRLLTLRPDVQVALLEEEDTRGASDRPQQRRGDLDAPRIVPFRDQYNALPPDRRGLVNGLVYPVRIRGTRSSAYT